MMLFGRVVVALTALMHAGFGVAYLFWPVQMARLTKFELQAPLAVTEMRTFYGGLELGLAVFLAICALRRDWVIAGLWATALIYAGIVLARVLGMILDGSVSRFLLQIAGVEVLVGLLAGLALFLLRTREAT